MRTKSTGLKPLPNDILGPIPNAFEHNLLVKAIQPTKLHAYSHVWEHLKFIGG